MGGGFEAGVALAAAAAFGNDISFFGLGEIFDDFIGFFIDDEGARRNFDDQIIALFAGFLLSLAVGPILGSKLPLESKGI
mgnify:CR=1 FL=1